MTPLRFYAARTLRNEPMLRGLSVPFADLVQELSGQRVALVGNARSLAKSTHGAAIDASDLVVRINRAPMPAAISHGARTDWLGLAVRLPKAERARLAPRRILWMSPKRKRLDWHSARSAGFYLHPLGDYRALAEELGAPPSTGLMLAALILRAPVAGLTLYGFDFFASKSLSGSRDAARVPHDFGAEAAWIADRMASDPRLRIA